MNVSPIQDIRNKQRQYWLDKIDKQITELKFLSLEGKHNIFKEVWGDLELSFLCLYKFDNDLRRGRAEEAREIEERMEREFEDYGPSDFTSS